MKLSAFAKAFKKNCFQRNHINYDLPHHALYKSNKFYCGKFHKKEISISKYFQIIRSHKMDFLFFLAARSVGCQYIFSWKMRHLLQLTKINKFLVVASKEKKINKEEEFGMSQ